MMSNEDAIPIHYNMLQSNSLKSYCIWHNEINNKKHSAERQATKSPPTPSAWKFTEPRSCSLERRLSGAASDQKPASSDGVEIHRIPHVKSEQKQILLNDVFRDEKH